MKHSSFATSLPTGSNHWDLPNPGVPKSAPSQSERIEAGDPEAVAAFASIHKKTLATDESELLRLFLGDD